jgi:hypothetical protein
MEISIIGFEKNAEYKNRLCGENADLILHPVSGYIQ